MMDWQLAIDKNREKLISIVIELMTRLGLVDGGRLTTLPCYLYRTALLIIRPAESAIRRLIMMVAYEMELRGIKQRARQGVMTGNPDFSFALSLEDRMPTFNLIDPRKTFAPERPDYTGFGPLFDDEQRSADRTPTPAAGLGRRLLALKQALDNLQRQARRLTRWYAAQDVARRQNRPLLYSHMRPGLPPGWRKKTVHEINEILLDCHYFAHRARERRDSS